LVVGALAPVVGLICVVGVGWAAWGGTVGLGVGDISLQAARQRHKTKRMIKRRAIKLLLESFSHFKGFIIVITQNCQGKSQSKKPGNFLAQNLKKSKTKTNSLG
jgi:hypothetical protein